MPTNPQSFPAARSRQDACGNNGISVAAARRVAERAHAGQVDGSGEPYISHVARVAAAVPSFARPVAWLHDALERSNIDERSLIDAGASADECHAVRILSRDLGARSDGAYLAHARTVALAGGIPGKIAPAVKRADLLDHISHPPTRHSGWTPPYEAAFVVLTVVSNRVATSRGSSPAEAFRHAGLRA